MKQTSTKGFWAKFEVSKKDWDEFYSKLMYTRLEDQLGNIYAAKCFSMGDHRLIECTEEEKREIDNHRKANNCSPRPFKDINR